MDLSRCHLFSVFGVLLLLCSSLAKGQHPDLSHDDVLAGDTEGVHDPSLIQSGQRWYLFSTSEHPGGPQIPIRCSTDHLSWKLCGNVFTTIPEWIRNRTPSAHDLWAPDISFVNGEYRLYYAASTIGKNSSVIALVTNTTLDMNDPAYKWVDRGSVIESTADDDFNAIDPNFVRDSGHDDWLVFGSYWTGIKLHMLASDGTLSKIDTHLYSLANRSRPKDAAEKPSDWQAIEAPFLLLHGDFYYLFTSWDHCCRGAKSDYRIMVGRSHRLLGPYVDKNGTPLLDGGGAEVLRGNDRWAGPGGESVVAGERGDAMVYHAYDRSSGVSALQIRTIEWLDGWPAVQ